MKTLAVILGLLFSFQGFAQNTKSIKKSVQLSGVVVTGDSLKSVPAVWIKILKTDSIDYNYLFSTPTDANGFFVLMARPGDVIGFKKEGYADTNYTLSDTLKANHLSIIQTIKSLKDTVH